MESFVGFSFRQKFSTLTEGFYTFNITSKVVFQEIFWRVREWLILESLYDFWITDSNELVCDEMVRCKKMGIERTETSVPPSMSYNKFMLMNIRRPINVKRTSVGENTSETPFSLRRNDNHVGPFIQFSSIDRGNLR